MVTHKSKKWSIVTTSSDHWWPRGSPSARNNWTRRRSEEPSCRLRFLLVLLSINTKEASTYFLSALHDSCCCYHESRVHARRARTHTQHKNKSHEIKRLRRKAQLTCCYTFGSVGTSDVVSCRSKHNRRALQQRVGSCLQSFLVNSDWSEWSLVDAQIPSVIGPGPNSSPRLAPFLEREHSEGGELLRGNTSKMTHQYFTFQAETAVDDAHARSRQKQTWL